jgi:hypothetical protein
VPRLFRSLPELSLEGAKNRSDDLFQELRDERIQGAAGEALLTELVYFVEQKGISSVEGTLHAFGFAPPIADIPGVPIVHELQQSGLAEETGTTTQVDSP